MSHYNTLHLQRPRPEIVVATLNRPNRLNAITSEMFEEFVALQCEVENDEQVRVLVLTGEGRAFCSGLDLDEAAQLPGMPAATMLRSQESWARAIAGFRHLSKPVIAAVNGPAAGAGFALALAADIRIASGTAKFNAAFVTIGLSGGDVGTSWALPRIVGLGTAYEILLTGRVVDADEAKRIGLVVDSVSEDGLMDRILQTAELIVGNSPVGITLTKAVVQNNIDAPSLAAALELENRNQVLATRTDDMVEALTAFREKRPPKFNGH